MEAVMPDYTEKMVCDCCGAECSVVRGDYRFVESGLNNVWLQDIEIVRCEKCNNEDPIIPAVGSLLKVVLLAIAEKPARLEGREIRFLRRQAGFTQQQLSGMLGVDKSTISKWENGEDPIGPTSDRLLRTIAICQGDPSKAQDVINTFAAIDVNARSQRIQINPFGSEPSFVYASGA
jgi:putative zinc finger/helix-turn-helix YgiT family protein